MIEPILEADRLLRYGMLDRAEALYRSVADEHPDNAYAQIGLARVASERGDDQTAYRFASEAARLDSDNTNARALAARLGELAGMGRPESGEIARRQKDAGRFGRIRRAVSR